MCLQCSTKPDDVYDYTDPDDEMETTVTKTPDNVTSSLSAGDAGTFKSADDVTDPQQY